MSHMNDQIDCPELGTRGSPKRFNRLEHAVVRQPHAVPVPTMLDGIHVTALLTTSWRSRKQTAKNG